MATCAVLRSEALLGETDIHRRRVQRLVQVFPKLGDLPREVRPKVEPRRLRGRFVRVAHVQVRLVGDVLIHEGGTFCVQRCIMNEMVVRSCLLKSSSISFSSLVRSDAQNFSGWAVCRIPPKTTFRNLAQVVDIRGERPTCVWSFDLYRCIQCWQTPDSSVGPSSASSVGCGKHHDFGERHRHLPRLCSRRCWKHVVLQL